MQQVKLFKGLESELGALENEVNRWLRQRCARVISISGNIAPQTFNPEAQGGGLSKTVFSPSDVLLVVLCEVAEG